MKCYKFNLQTKMIKFKQIFTIFICITGFLFLSYCSTLQKSSNKTPDKPTSSVKSEQNTSQKNKKKQITDPDREKIQNNIKKNSQGEPIPQEKEKPSEILEEALDAYQDAQTAWEKADIDTALAALDEAYKLILKLKLPQDSPLIQEKNDLRLLIARRIQEIYASHLIAVGNNHKTIPLPENKYVKAEIESFQTKERTYFKESYKRSGRYIEMIRKEMKKEGLPEELIWMPVIESWFKVRAYSRARALGLWQFIASTGYRFGLKRDRWIDERMDPEKSTKAAVKYLKELHSFFGDWTTALASYNCGEFRVQRLIRSQRINYFDNFWDLFSMLPRETARFVPRFIATLLIIKNPQKYGFNLPIPESPIKYEIVKTNRSIRLSSLSSIIGLEKEALASLNPELRHKATPDGEYILKVPAGTSREALVKLDSIPRWIPPRATYVIHYVRRGETVSRIARRYRTSISAIARMNRLRRSYLIRPGQRLKIPSRGRKVRYTYKPPRKLIKDKEKLMYIVKRGDSLFQIAAAFNTSVEKIKRVNNLTSNILNMGQKLEIQSWKPKGTIPYTVKAGDTPYTIAKKFGMNLKDLLNLNMLTSRSNIYPGQNLWVIKK